MNFREAKEIDEKIRKVNARRIPLIMQDTRTSEEEQELFRLQTEIDTLVDLIAPLPKEDT